MLSEAKELPLPVFGEPDYPEETRLKYRFLDLRRETLHANIMKRQAIIWSLRKRMRDAGFFEFQTPILTASSPEGARDYLVPSRVHPGKFYALPQAPQQFKQLIMIAGFDRYFQIAPCFRDEDARADRSPGEFYQLDLEMSFVTQEDVFDTVEPILRGLFEEFGGGKPVTKKFPRIPYAEAMRKYGTDKPDLRNPIEMQDATEHFRGSGFKVFAGMLDMDVNTRIWAIPAKGGGSRAVCDRMNAWAQEEGQPGLGYIFFREGEGAGPIAKNIGPERTEAIKAQLGLADGDAVFFVAGLPNEFADFAAPRAREDRQRTRAHGEGSASSSAGSSTSRCMSGTRRKGGSTSRTIPSPCRKAGSKRSRRKDPLDILAYQYDVVCNGVELSSGAIRNHKPEIMEKAFAIAGYPKEELEKRFGGMLRALQYGAPPAWRHRARHRPHGDAALRRGESARRSSCFR